MNSLHRCLVDYDMAMLRALAANRGVLLDTNRQTEAVDRLAIALAEPESVAHAVSRLSSASRSALDRLLAAGGQMREAHFGREAGQIRPVGPGRLEREAPWQSPANAAEELLYLGLIFRGFRAGEGAGGPGQFVAIPNELRPLLPAPQAAAPVLAVEAVPGPETEPRERTLDEDLFVYVVYLQNHAVRTYADGRLGRRDSQALLGRLGQPADRRLALVRHLAERLGLAARQDEHLRLQPAALKGWLTAAPERQLAMLAEAWRDDPAWIDLCQVPSLVCDTTTDWLARYDALAARRAVLGLLAHCPTGAWWHCASFIAAVKRAAPDFQRPDADYEAWYIRDASGDKPAYLSGFESWEQVDGALLADLLAGPLRWLGVVVRAGTEAEPLCRLTALGSRFLGLPAPEAAVIQSPPVVVQADFGIDLPPPASRYVRFQLERFADVERAEPCRYRLTVRGLSRALERGLQVDQILAYLGQASGRPVPPNVAGQLRLWAGRLGQVRLEEVVLLHVKSERVLTELSTLPQTRGLIDRVLSPTVALVRKHNLPRLEKALRELGYLPPEEIE